MACQVLSWEAVWDEFLMVCPVIAVSDIQQSNKSLHRYKGCWLNYSMWGCDSLIGWLYPIASRGSLFWHASLLCLHWAKNQGCSSPILKIYIKNMDAVKNVCFLLLNEVFQICSKNPLYSSLAPAAYPSVQALYSPLEWGQALFPLSESDDVILLVCRVNWPTWISIREGLWRWMRNKRTQQSGGLQSFTAPPQNTVHPEWWKLFPFWARPVLVIPSPRNQPCVFSFRSGLD